MEQKKLYQSKTFWTGVAAITSAAAGFFTGTLPAAMALQTGFTGLIGVFMRSGMLKK